MPVITETPRPGFARSLRATVRHIAGGIDAFARVRHGTPVPPDHPAREQHLAGGRLRHGQAE
ncbi:hypothetical protein [Nocardia asteroides]|uniref:hypothetical protein n=1 Tax=Nocardia asteroides TaxID=1824 RepID=UPI001E4ABF3D|nr:hypothetical protein [Nocardia asteroides]UGT57203.1 hypothetical protein LTT85_10315 [Nocardia asteroides]